MRTPDGEFPLWSPVTRVERSKRAQMPHLWPHFVAAEASWYFPEQRPPKKRPSALTPITWQLETTVHVRQRGEGPTPAAIGLGLSPVGWRSALKPVQGVAKKTPKHFWHLCFCSLCIISFAVRVRAAVWGDSGMWKWFPQSLADCKASWSHGNTHKTPGRFTPSVWRCSCSKRWKREERVLCLLLLNVSLIYLI